MSDGVSSELGELLSTHEPSTGLGRGWPAWMSGGALGAVFTLVAVYLAFDMDDGPSLRLLGGAAVMGAFSYYALRNALRAMKTCVFVFEMGMVVQTPETKGLFRWADIDRWTAVTVPGVRKRYEEDFGNIVQIVISVGPQHLAVPDQLVDFEGIHSALSENVPVERNVLRKSSHWG